MEKKGGGVMEEERELLIKIRGKKERGRGGEVGRRGGKGGGEGKRGKGRGGGGGGGGGGRRRGGRRGVLGEIHIQEESQVTSWVKGIFAAQQRLIHTVYNPCMVILCEY